MAFGLSAGAIAGIAGVGGALISADAAGNAADAQKDSANQTNATNIATSRRQQELQEPFREAGLLGNNRLMHLLGLQSEGDTAALSKAFDSIYRQERQIADEKHRAYKGFGFDDAPAYAQGIMSGWDEEIRAEAKKRAQTQVSANGGGSPGGDFGSLMKNFTNEDFEKDPGYQFRMDEGTKAVEGGAAARGGLLSGAAQKALLKYGQGFASNEFGNAYGRFENNKTNNYNRLAGLVNSGQGATNQMSNTAGQFAQNNANALGAYGNAAAAGSIGQANALNQGIGNATNYYQQDQMAQRLQQQQNNQNELMKLIRNPGSTAPAAQMDWYN